jgi:TonB-linked SusC/RagA family outer membrane protein
MKKKLLNFLWVLLLLAIQAHAQTRTVTGTVTAKEDGQPLPGVTVRIEGTQTGTQTNADGQFKISVPSGAQKLSFKYVGYENLVLDASGNTVNAVLSPSSKQLVEVIVTALGEKREAKSLGYSVTSIKNDALTAGRSTNIVNSLAGKVAGVKILSSGGATGASSNINIRTATTFTGSNQPLFVVDGIPIDNGGGGQAVNTGSTNSNRAIDLNQDDIESVSVLKGPAAAVLYGSRAVAGAIIITTKRGSKNSAGKVELSSYFNSEVANRLPDYQNTYSQGANGVFNAFSQMSWGAKITGQTVQNYLGNNETLTAYPNNVKDIFRNGYNLQNNVTLSGGTDKSTYYFNYGNYNENGYITNNNLNKNNVTFNGTSELSKKLTLAVSAQYIRTTSVGTPTGNARSNPLFDGITLPRSYNLANYPFETADGLNNIPTSSVPNAAYTYYNVLGTDNPLWSTKYDLYTQKIDRIIANAGFDYKVLPWLTANYKLGIDAYVDVSKTINEKSANNNQSANRVGSIIDNTTNRHEVSSYFNLIATKRFLKDFGIRFLLGNEVNYRRLDQLQVTGNGIQAAHNYNIANTLTYVPAQSLTEQSLIGVYADASFDYKSMAYLSFTGRRDQSSTFSPDHNTYFYPSVNASLILSEAIPVLKNSEILSYWKIRGNYAKLGREAAPYNTSTYYGTNAPADGFGPTLIYPFNGINGQTYGNSAGNPNLKPEFTATREIGTELRFLHDRINIDFTYFTTTSTDIIFGVPTAPSSGFTAQQLNAGTLKGHGIELLIGGTPVKTHDFSWDISFNFTKNRTEVTELAAGVPFIGNGGFTNPQGRIVTGLQYGTLFGQVFNKINGKDVVDANGRLSSGQINTATLAVIGDPNPMWLGGLTNTFTYKGFTLSAFVDIRVGGDIYSRTITDLKRYGVAAETGDRQRLYVHNAVNADGTPNNTLITAEQYYSDLYSSAAQQYAVFDGSWLRLRDLSLAYRVPTKALGNGKFIKGISLGLTGHNLILYAPNYPHLDPESNLLGVSNGQGIEYNGQPQTKTYGGYVKLTF